MARDGAVIGVDVGTTAVKVGLYDADATEHVVASREYALDDPEPGWAEQDPDAIVEATLDAIEEVAGHASAYGIAVSAVSISTVMHSLLGLDADGRPVTPLIIYADTRAAPEAAVLRADHVDVYRRTGTPLHPMAPLAKLRWLAAHQPDVAASVRTWGTIKEQLLAALTGEAVLDHAGASATGLFNLSDLDWDDEALSLAGIDRDQLAPLVPTDHVLDGLTAAAAGRTGLPRDTPVVAGATDGIMANLGVGAIGDGIGALTVGTSGAIRVIVDEPVTDPAMRTFCYALTPGRWCVGGAISNGGLWLTWLRDHVLDGRVEVADLTASAGDVPPGAEGVLVLPYLTGERAPQWSGAPSGVVFGLRYAHRRGHLVRAGLEGVAHQLRLVADALDDTGHGLRRLRATGGFLNSPLWVQLVADVLRVPLEVPEVAEAAAFGAAVLGMTAVGLLDDLDAVEDLITITDHIDPDDTDRAVHEQVHRRYAQLIDLLSGSSLYLGL